METLEFIKDYFKPIQPAASLQDESVLYQELKPDKNLQAFIYCFWQLKTRTPLSEPYFYRVVSDGCIDVFFNHKNATENFVMGFCKKYTAFPIGQSFDYIGIRFFPSVFPLIFNVDAKTLSDHSQVLHKILPDFSGWISANIKQPLSFENIVVLLNKKLNSIVSEKNFDFDIRFYKALKFIFSKNGHLNVENELNVGLSARQLRRIFNFYIGTTAKKFSNVVRFQYILQHGKLGVDFVENKNYYDVGFFDQAHFIKHFKTFYGVTPSEAFK